MLSLNVLISIVLDSRLDIAEVNNNGSINVSDVVLITHTILDF